ncbi:mannosyl-glycoprotein endo-beta-N-acetylglucosaminidase [Entomortierella parvispora]|uniref:Mannosyl-glycoprotein endo-beta-N-acetylglucosaminidase n=1 Tax=Entomortierella parvispora TaxID=205924 RepID=A0A9P3LZE4_9FUNG|nr:mannosyl-glycoprotein endo-beta-N-acetylglucosaminidase [Entomortierella parvispora]
MVSIPDTTIPKSQPLRSFKDLLAWQPGQDPYNVSNTPLHKRPPTLDRGMRQPPSNPDDLTQEPLSSSSGRARSNLKDCKVIVCHDMAGGYKEDNLPQGNDESSIYSIQYWSHIDTFIYFSHSRISIPPVVWTNAAHRNGVRCLGTIITEWLEGILETDEMVTGPCSTLVDEDNPENDPVDRRWFSRTYADKLVAMAVYYGFDGWFINIESILRGGGIQANQLIAFLRYLRQQIHAKIPGGELIWYDSVISTTGEVAWQDKLSVNNYRFFEQSDGLFTNYTWKENSVGESVALAGGRVRDVYTGIDIWGRHTFGGGGYMTYKALEVIQREGTSCAIFAPAWTYESLKKDDFMTNDRLFWTGYSGAGIHAESLGTAGGIGGDKSNASILLNSLRGHLQRAVEENGGYWGGEGGEEERAFLPISAYIPARPSGCSSWFYTDFDRGFGKGFWNQGKKVSEKPWSKLSHQSLSPNMNKEVYLLKDNIGLKAVPTKGIRWIVSPEDAYNGGSSVVIQEFSLSDERPFPPTLPMPIPPPKIPTDPDTPSPAPQPPQPEPSEPAPPSPPKGVYPLPGIELSTTRSNSVLVPLFDTQISLWAAQNSTIELMFKPLQDDVQVGIHLGILATNSGGRSVWQQASAMETRKVTETELWSLLHPDIKQPQQRNRRASSFGELDLEVIEQVDLGEDEEVEDAASSLAQFTQRHLSLADASESTGLLAVVTLDDPSYGSEPVGSFVAVTPSPGDEGSVYAVEAMGDGWKRLTLHLSTLLALNGEQRGSDGDSGSDPDIASIILSQLGVTLTFESEKRKEDDILGGEECSDKSPRGLQPPSSASTRPLVILGSLALVPTWSAHYRGSSVQGLKGDDNHVIIVERPDSSLIPPPAREQGISDSFPAPSASVSLPSPADGSTIRLPHPVKTRLRISSTLSWDIGFPIVPPGEEELMSPHSSSSLALSSSSSLYCPADELSTPTADYSHFCIYISTKVGSSHPLPPSISSLPGSVGGCGNDPSSGEHFQFLGTAFTNQYRISNLKILIDGLNPDALRANLQNARQKESQSLQEQEQLHQQQQQQQPQATESSPAQKSPPNSSGNGVWFWVQGVRRDGRSDARSEWARWQLI